ncbi:class I SAM-dependent methyltransferase [Nocardioides sp. HDW12B]|nr:class I SAM-dependent methyltransferase [Nocardioides sp. HDW12B]
MAYGPLTIAYDHRVLEPRPWTVAQSHWVSGLLHDAPPGPVLEVCSGAGHIGLLAVHGHARPLTMVDLSPVACSFAEVNAQGAGMREQVTVRCGRMDEVLDPEERFAAIIADPPWVASADVLTFPEDPRLAIDGGVSGFDLVRSCLQVIGQHLAPAGFAVLQVGPDDQADEVAAHVDAHPALDLQVVETRTFDRGALVLLRRPTA